MVGRIWEFCAGVNCSADLSEQMRAAWDANAARLEAAKSNPGLLQQVLTYTPRPFPSCLHLGPSLRRADGRAERIDFPL